MGIGSATRLQVPNWDSLPERQLPSEMELRFFQRELITLLDCACCPIHLLSILCDQLLCRATANE
jgi:hypothetical protein